MPRKTKLQYAPPHISLFSETAHVLRVSTVLLTVPAPIDPIPQTPFADQQRFWPALTKALPTKILLSVPIT